MKNLLWAVLTLFISITTAQSTYSQQCDCSTSLEKTIAIYEKNYSLFQYKVSEENEALYKAHTDLLRLQAVNVSSTQECKLVLDRWLTFFRDKHNYIEMIATDIESIEEVELEESVFQKNYKSNNYGQNPIIGIWQRSGYRVAIIPTPQQINIEEDFIGIVLQSQNKNWKSGQVKFKLTNDFGTSYQATLRKGDFTPARLPALQKSNDILTIGKSSKWTKVWPESDSKQAVSDIIQNFDTFHFTEVEGIPYLRFPDFYTVEASYVDSIMTANHDKLISSDFIIIDARENKGGNDNVYAPILPYILDGPIEIPNSGLWMSDDNIQQFLNQSDLRGKSVEDFTEEERAMYDYVISLKGTAFFQSEGYSTSYEPDTTFSGPKKVILLATEAGSSGETFVYKAKQSKRVVVYGQNTLGVVDGFNGLSTEVGCFRLNYPSSFRARDVGENPIDPYGIAPDVYVEEETDVLHYAIEHMRQLIRLEQENRAN